MYKKFLIAIAFISIFINQGIFAQANNSLSFDGTNDMVSVSPFPSANGTISFTAWVKLNSTTGFSTFAAWAYSGDNLLIRTSSGNLQLIFENQAISGGAITAGSWYHIAFTKSGYNFKLYVNGVLKGSGPLGTSDRTFTSLHLGSLLGTLHYLNGVMDDIGIWNTELTIEEIKAFSSFHLTGNEPGLLACYNFNGGVAGGDNTGLTTLDDVSPNSNNGSLNNFALTGSTSNYVAGKSFVIYVDQAVFGSNDGTSWANAYTSLQSGLDAAVSGDQIWVAKGTYKPSSAYDLTNTSRYYHFRMKDGVTIYGGFAGTEAVKSQRTDFAVGGTNETILSGDIGVPDDNSDNCYHIFYHPDSYGLTSSAILNGFTIKYGYADGTGTELRGGGMHNGTENNPTIDQCSFLNNFATYGGGIYNITCSPTISNCLFSANTATQWGGGIYNTTNAQTQIVNCLIINNHSNTTGGGIYNYDVDGLHPCNVVITNTTVANNSAGYCGGVRIYFCTVTLNNCIVWGNTHTSSTYGSQISVGAASKITTINNSCYSNNTSDIFGSPVTSNCITTDPQFAETSNNDFRISGNSPCKNTGDNSYNTQTYDMRGQFKNSKYY